MFTPVISKSPARWVGLTHLCYQQGVGSFLCLCVDGAWGGNVGELYISLGEGHQMVQRPGGGGSVT